MKTFKEIYTDGNGKKEKDKNEKVVTEESKIYKKAKHLINMKDKKMVFRGLENIVFDLEDNGFTPKEIKIFTHELIDDGELY